MKHASKPFHTGIKAFDQTYGSQARGGDAWLFFGQSGGGKTVLACQTAAYTASEGKLVAYVTTHTDPALLLLRAYSSVSSIPYDDLKRVSGSRGHHPLASALTEWWSTHERNLEIVDWRQITGPDFETKYNYILNSIYAKHGRVPDLTVIDQLSGVLQPPFVDHIQKREACNEVATIVARTAAKLDNVAILITQANGRCASKADLTVNDMADSKSLWESMSGVIGITSLAEHDTARAEVYSRNQYLVVCRCREEASRIMVKRDFAKARFVGHFD